MKRRIISLFLATAVGALAVAAPAFALDAGSWREAGAESGEWEEPRDFEIFNALAEKEPSEEGKAEETGNSEIPDNEEAPENPEMPGNPEASENPGETENWGNVENSGNTEPPEISEIPGTPEPPEISETPEAPTDSENFWDPWEEEENSFEDFEFAVFDEENAGQIQTDTQDAEELLSEIRAGEVLALAPVENVTLESAAMVGENPEEGAISLEAETGTFTLKIGAYYNMDEIWVNNGAALNHFGTVYREIVYTDDEGVTRKSPVYCMNASKSGPLSQVEIKDEAIKVLSNSSIKKILYYGYGGPGDISDSYDPTCSHCDWSKKENRYVLTHYALSKLYSNDVAGATTAECDHVGLNRWINKLTSLAVPNVQDLKFYGKDSNGDTVSTKDMSANLTCYKVVPQSLSWCGMKEGVQISSVYRLTSSLDKNGIRFTKAASAPWMMGYWTSEEDYTTRGIRNPRILGAGKSVTLYKGARIRFAFPHNVTGNQKMTYTSILKPVEYVVISTSVQLNMSDMQDLGTYYHEGKRETLSLTFRPAPTGTILLKKTADHAPNMKISGAGYHLKAAEEIVSNGTVVLKKDETMAEGYTDKNGEIILSGIPAGKYYLIEKGAKEGSDAENYLIDTTKHPVTVVKNTSSTVAVSEIPDMKGKVSIRKVIQDTELNLEGAEFTLYSYSKSSGKYTNGVKLGYDPSSKRYVSEELCYTSDNQGKFLVEETKNPDGFTGTFREEFSLTKPGEEELFEFTAENITAPMRVEITKVDSVTKELLKDAEFTIFEWDGIKQAYKNIGELLTFQTETKRYQSKELKITDQNQGRFKVEETRLPEGYTGTFVQELNLYEGNAKLQFTVENTPIPPKKGNITIRKTDSIKGTILSDAEFTVYQYNNVSGKYENTLGDMAKLRYDAESGLYISEDLAINNHNEGKFKVVETKIPTGYLGVWEKEFILTEENLHPETFEAVNEPDRPALTEITVTKKLKEKDILWSHGNPVFSFVAEGTDEKGIRRQYENYICFSPGGYTVDENGYAVLQITFRNVPAGQYEVYEKPVLYYYLTDCIANSSNVSVIKESSPAYGKQPKNIAYGIIRLTADDPKASITFINTKGRYDRYVHNDVVKNRIPNSFE